MITPWKVLSAEGTKDWNSLFKKTTVEESCPAKQRKRKTPNGKSFA
jgi:hypothetical protein